MATLLARLPAIIALAIALVGALSQPEVLALLPAQVATAVTVVGAVLTALTRPVAGNAAARPPQLPAQLPPEDLP